LSTTDAPTGSYAVLSEEELIDWARRAFAAINANDSYNNGSKVEGTWNLVNLIREAETSPIVLDAIAPLLDVAAADMDELISVMAQDIP
jgi:hypothetical protein